MIELKGNTSYQSEDGSRSNEDDITFITRRFKCFLIDKKKNIDWRKSKGKLKRSPKVADLIFYDYKKLGHIK